MECTKLQFIPKYESESFQIWILLNVSLVTLVSLHYCHVVVVVVVVVAQQWGIRIAIHLSLGLLILHYYLSATARGARESLMVQYCTKPKLFKKKSVALYWL
jgi:hypothetical protein